MAILNDNKVIVLDQLPIELEAGTILKQMKIHGDARRFETPLLELFEVLRPLARPKALIKVVCVDHKTPESLQIDGITFDSKLVRLQLDPVETAFVCMTTVGTEVESIEPPRDVIKRFCLDAIKNHLLFIATSGLKKFLQETYQTGTLTNLNPGETDSFPIIEQRKIFQIIGDVEGYIGVRLSENCALIPTKSHSGIYFSTEVEFISCRLCTNQRCQGRRAPYEPELAQRYKH
ncbi:MAG TPA: hypothetical protein VLH15_05460 [Dehalococcoidales bacterium]|nr:hypothetical protein [Dehalococcoidales bacterium]